MAGFLDRVKNNIGNFIVEGLMSHDRLLDIQKKLLLKNDSVLLRKIMLDDQSRVMKRVMLDNGLIKEEQLTAILEFQEHWNILRPIIQADREEIIKKYHAVKNGLKKKSDVKDGLLDIICEGDTVFLANGPMRFPDRHSLWILLREILVNEDYYFETDTDSPRILDCGTHFGLAVYYFKSVFPKAEIVGFEPIEKIRHMALENVQRHGYSDVQILPYALHGANEPMDFYVTDTDSMAGSLTERRLAFGDDIHRTEVECRTLSQFLNEPVHFLKIDIEGVEDIVLDEARAFLKNVQHIFCEYHHGAGLDTNRLEKILSLLGEAGFGLHLGKSFSFQKGSMNKPMTFTGKPYSMGIWGKNENWKY